ncbi:hypothetical protein HRM2_05670 [Desulforapulum autotrophicum HRM2]|uniref:Uncharacterized protein n=1 Tax=Desulforapulum autotrophicum (strain ATCC 43914 / DSM 3382 / VKM B-1955 / HRM2) TaxID=177437 RepID=C0QHX3_DESAH|nr:hypothetical protein HRM2_05670 [Desulforapulum autotrophicum HRM2]
MLSWIRHSRILTEPDPGIVTSFNPCCRGSGIPGMLRLLAWFRHKIVSILVVVDQAFQVSSLRADSSLYTCFNPCCRGSGIPGLVGMPKAV